MLLGEWNETLLAWFFSRRPHERVYLRVDDAELERINADRALGLHDPAQDLVSAVRDEVQGMPSLRWLRRRGDEWRSGADPDEVPPWLGLLAGLPDAALDVLGGRAASRGVQQETPERLLVERSESGELRLTAGRTGGGVVIVSVALDGEAAGRARRRRSIRPLLPETAVRAGGGRCRRREEPGSGPRGA